MSSIVAIVGRPNVGKSTLFNRITGTRDAIVDETSGTTRDRHYGKVEWNGKIFSVIDTGGYVSHSEDIFESEINKQVKLSIEEADCVIFVVDVTTGITALDEAVANLLRKSKKKVFLVVNKVDNQKRLLDAHEFYALGLDEFFCVSAITGSGTGELLDAITAFLPADKEESEIAIPRLAIVGKPNVGKSSLVNTLLGEERHIVTPVAGTTRDSIHSYYKKYNYEFILTDTAGIRRKSKVHNNIEFYSVMRSIRAIETSDVCLLMIDATTGLEAQDMHIFRLIVTNKKGCVLLVNKWDLVEKDHKTHDEYLQGIKQRLAPFNDLPILFISAITKQRVYQVLEAAQKVYLNMQRRISTSELNDFLQEAIVHYPPPALNGKPVQIKYATQLPSKTPSFAFFANHPQYVKEPYKRYLENRLREKFDFTGVPVSIYIRQK